VGQSQLHIDQNDTGSVADVAQPAGRPPLKLMANADGASIASGPEPLTIVDAGLTLVTIRPDGEIGRLLRFAPDEPLTLPVDPAVFTFDRELPCLTLPAGRSTDVTAVVANGGLLTTMERSGRAVVHLEFLEPQLRALRARLLQQGRAGVSVQTTSRTATRVIFERASVSRPVFEVVLPGAVAGVAATLEPGGILDDIRVCAALPPPVLRQDTASGPIDVGPEGNGNFGAGWHDAERAGAQAFRWSERVSTFVIPLDAPASLDLRWLFRAASPDGANITASVGTQGASSCVLPPGRWTECRLRIASELTTRGVNRVVLTSTTAVEPDASRTGDPRQLAFESRGGTVRTFQ
jgi:hypothetical protein